MPALLTARRNRLRGMDRGTLSGDPPALQTPIADNDLAAAQDWTTLDRRGNWGQFDYTIGVTPQSARLAGGRGKRQ